MPPVKRGLESRGAVQHRAETGDGPEWVDRNGREFSRLAMMAFRRPLRCSAGRADFNLMRYRLRPSRPPSLFVASSPSTCTCIITIGTACRRRSAAGNDVGLRERQQIDR